VEVLIEEIATDKQETVNAGQDFSEVHAQDALEILIIWLLLVVAEITAEITEVELLVLTAVVEREIKDVLCAHTEKSNVEVLTVVFATDKLETVNADQDISEAHVPNALEIQIT
jgi:uncharacterized UBP type Zn finger protein